MKKFLVSGVALIALATAPALAADMPARTRMPVKAPVAPPPAMFSWSGFYIGGHGGYGFGEKCFAFVGADEGCHDNDGWVGGGQIGFNWQQGNVVFGAEFSGSASRLTGDHTIPGTLADTYSSRVDGIFLLTGKLGLAMDRTLLYVTGGGAGVRDRYTYTDGLTGFTSTARDTRWGWTVGAGIEFALAPNWSVAAQYNYVDLGDKDRSFSGLAGTFTENIDQQLHLATLRLNYRFGGASY